MTPPFDRTTVRELLLRWERSEIGWQEAVAEAESATDSDDVPDLGRDGADATTLEVMSILDRLHIEYLVRADVPALLRFLDTPPGQEVRGWADLDAYFGAIDVDARARTWPAGA